MAEPYPQDLLRIGVDHQRAGRIAEARRCFERALRRDPHNADALQMLGLATIDSGEVNKGLQLLRRALSHAPRRTTVLNNLAIELCRLGRPQDALPYLDRALALEPQNRELQLHHALALRDSGRPDEALAALHRLVAAEPMLVAARLARGALLADRGETASALADFDAAVAADGGAAAAHAKRGTCLARLGQTEAALAAVQAALDRAGDPPLLHECAVTLAALGRDGDAEGCLRAALKQRPDDAAMLALLGDITWRLGRAADAVALFDRALALQPRLDSARHNRASALSELGRYQDAAAGFDALLQASPDHPYAAGERLYATLQGCDWAGYTAAVAAVEAQAAAGGLAEVPLICLAHAERPSVQRQCAEAYVRDRTGAGRPRLAAKPGRTLRLAYVSCDFRNHATSFLMAGVFERHDRRRVEPIAISLQKPEDSPIGRRVHAAFERFVDVSGRTDSAIAQLMREMEIDIAIDLMGHTGGSRMGIFAHRAAPLQVNYLGYPGTTGAPYIDAIIADPFVIPPGAEPHYSETVARLPHCFQANDDKRSRKPAPSREAAGLPASGLVFACFSAAYKITPALFGVFLRLLGQVDASVLWLAVAAPQARTNLRAAAAAAGIDPARLIFAEALPYEDHLARLALADLALDSFPFNGGTTVSDALWCGVPVVTRAGEPFAARMAGSLLRTIGLADLITGSFAAYEALVLDLAQDRARLQGVKARLETGIAASPLFDTAGFCQSFEELLVGLHGSRL